MASRRAACGGWLYTGHRNVGNAFRLWGRCTCGLTLENEAEVDGHTA